MKRKPKSIPDREKWLYQNPDALRALERGIASANTDPLVDLGRIAGVLTTHNREVALHVHPHYSDDRFEQIQTVFGDPEPTGRGHEGLHYAYSDRLLQWNADKEKAAARAASDSGARKHSARYYDAYLTAYFDRPCRVEHVMAGVNRSNGHPYAVFGYRFLNESKEAQR